MRILMTGFTATQVSGKFSRYARPCFVQALRQGFLAAGHQVDLRAVTVGEDLREYDHLVLGIFDAGALGSMNYKWGAMWSALAFTGRTTFYVDDSEWQLIFGCLYRFWRNAHHTKTAEMMTLKQAVGDLVDARLTEWIDSGLPGKCILPAFNWGDDSVFPGKTCGIVRADMTWMLPTHKHVAPDRKCRQWTIASCHDQGSYLAGVRRKWPQIDQGKGDTGWRPIDEAQVVQSLYSPSWGILNRPYRYAGFGRWRACYPYAAMVGSVLHCEPGECPQPLYNQSIDHIEALSDVQLADLATAQAEEFRAWTQTKEEFVERLQDSLK
jgi:hypothetical protein